MGTGTLILVILLTVIVGMLCVKKGKVSSDVDKNMVIAYCEGTDYSEINAIKDEFDNIYDARMFIYPAIEGWYEGLEKELTEAYEKAGWVKSKSYEPDWNNSDIPGGVMGLCFVKLTND